MTYSFHPAELTRSVLDWFVLSGITIEVDSNPVDYTQILAAKERALDVKAQELMNQPAPQASVKMAASAVRAPQVNYQDLSFNSLNNLNEFISSWKGFGLCKTASKAVIGSSVAANPTIAVIADFPDDMEDRSGEAFSSTPHVLIRQALKYAGIPEDQVYFTYLSKWRPPARRALASHEIDVCRHILSQELGFIRPQAILLLGESCLKALEPDSGLKTGKELMGKSYEKHMLNIKMTIYPSHRGEFLVKNTSMKRMLWNSLLDLAAATRAKA